jgi:hypothetical protein
LAKTAAILYQDEFRNSAMCAKQVLRKKKITAVSKEFKVMPDIKNIPKFGSKVDLMIWYSHGGWDGPMVFWDFTTEHIFQIGSDEPKEWAKLKVYFKSQIKPKGLFIAHSCHGAGSDRIERKIQVSKKNKIWVRDVAKDMDIYAFGQEGKAGVRNLPTVKAMLGFAFTGNPGGYPFRAFAPGGTRITKKANWPKF